MDARPRGSALFMHENSMGGASPSSMRDSEDWRSTETGPSTAAEIADDQYDMSCEYDCMMGEVCLALAKKGEKLTHIIHLMQKEAAACQQSLHVTNDKENAVANRLSALAKRISKLQKNREAIKLMLNVQMLTEERGEEGIVRDIEMTLLDRVPDDVKVLVSECLSTARGLDIDHCVICFNQFTSENLYHSRLLGRCRYSLFPCKHAAVCGLCAKHLWKTTKKCPLCREEITKRPQIFYPGH